MNTLKYFFHNHSNNKHLSIFGHYDCGGIQAAPEDHEHSLIDNWLRRVKGVVRFNTGLEHKEQVTNIGNTTTVQDAWKNGRELLVHGWIYNIENGLLKDMNACVSSSDD